jgi:hypothetical protein
LAKKLLQFALHSDRRAAAFTVFNVNTPMQFYNAVRDALFIISRNRSAISFGKYVRKRDGTSAGGRVRARLAVASRFVAEILVEDDPTRLIELILLDLLFEVWKHADVGANRMIRLRDKTGRQHEFYLSELQFVRTISLLVVVFLDGPVKFAFG